MREDEGSLDCDDDLPGSGWCVECGQECTPIAVDNGIGSYDYWGATGVHTQIDIESDCCNADVVDNERELPAKFFEDEESEE